MAVVDVDPGGAAVLSAAQTGNGDSTNIAARDPSADPASRAGALVITSAIGATPTVTVNIQGSVDGVSFFNIPYSLQATPRTFVTTAITITTAVTATYFLQELVPWRFLKLVYSANTNVTLTVTLFA